MHPIFNKDELVILNFFGGDPELTDRDGPANTLWYLVDRYVKETFKNEKMFAAPDYENITDGNSSGWNCLTLKKYLDCWLDAAKELGVDVEIANKDLINEGRYGDGHWEGVYLKAVENKTNYFYWIEESIFLDD